MNDDDIFPNIPPEVMIELERQAEESPEPYWIALGKLMTEYLKSQA